ncbi:hypothetical protein ACFONL_21275, partial [Camelimonas fluminis]
VNRTPQMGAWVLIRESWYKDARVERERKAHPLAAQQPSAELNQAGKADPHDIRNTGGKPSPNVTLLCKFVSSNSIHFSKGDHTIHITKQDGWIITHDAFSLPHAKWFGGASIFISRHSGHAEVKYDLGERVEIVPGECRRSDGPKF